MDVAALHAVVVVKPWTPRLSRAVVERRHSCSRSSREPPKKQLDVRLMCRKMESALVKQWSMFGIRKRIFISMRRSRNRRWCGAEHWSMWVHLVSSSILPQPDSDLLCFSLQGSSLEHNKRGGVSSITRCLSITISRSEDNVTKGPAPLAIVDVTIHLVHWFTAFCVRQITIEK
ncbi:hypothetical protein BD410DRAFT_788411 [Rickenella mellea]|uniref:Uncharacterized protein n=1 Tax=Rickenella mellea TaxID=50990 RepID=A0A4Y7Q5L4_9AGAM|nr:hypothetical protein BD410DRAFT_788411 [Rickenella mellea]